MIDRSILRPCTRHKAEVLTIVYRLVLWGGSSRYIYSSFSRNGSCNVRMAKIMLETIAPLAHDRCVLTGLHNIVRLDPLLSLEFLLHPSNLLKDLFRYASRVSESVFIEIASHVVVDYGRICHILGSSVCLSLTEIKGMCLSEAISIVNCDIIISEMRAWLLAALRQSRPEMHHNLSDVINANIDLEVILAFLFVFRSANSICNNGTLCLDTVKKISNVVNKLWELLFSRSTEYGGPLFCLFKLTSAMLIIKSALIASSVIDGANGTDYKEIVLDNVLVCFRFTCNECKHSPGTSSCGKQIIVGCSSNDAICDAINSIVTCYSSPLRVLSELLSYAQSTDWMDKFIWLDLPTVNIVESLRRDIMLPCEMIEKRCAFRLTSLAVKSTSYISSDDLPSLMAIMDNGFGACCVQKYEDSIDSSIYLKDAFIVAMKCYELFFEAQIKSTKRSKWSKWIECVVLASPHRILKKHDVCCFIVFIADICIFPIHKECIMEVSCDVRRSVNSLWDSGESKTSASCIANAVVSLCEGALFLGGAKSEMLRLWLKNNIHVGNNSVERHCNPIVTGFEDCYRYGYFLLPYEM